MHEMDFLIYHGKIKDPKEINIIKKRLIENPDIIGFLNPRYLICEEQLLNAILLTFHAFETKTNFSPTFGIELYLKLAGVTQIKNALPYFELNKNSEEVIVISSKEVQIKGLPLEKGLPSLNPDNDVKEYYLDNHQQPLGNLCDYAVAKSVESLLK